MIHITFCPLFFIYYFNIRYKQKDGKSNDPKWILNKDKYNPGHNKAPQSFCPVLLSNNHFKNGRDKLEIDDTCFEEGERVLCAMKWGLVPSWSPGIQDLNIYRYIYLVKIEKHFWRE